MRPEKLSTLQIGEEVGTVTQWSVQSDTLRREFKFTDFADAMTFVNRVADLAEAMNHHPDIDIRYNRVTLALSTHDAGGLTKLDFDLARQIDGV